MKIPKEGLGIIELRGCSSHFSLMEMHEILVMMKISHETWRPTNFSVKKLIR